MKKTKIVGVIASKEDLDQALGNPNIADIFEFRVDCAINLKMHIGLQNFPKPLIITARDSREGGKRPDWKIEDREFVYRTLLPMASFIDIEVSTAPILTQTISLAKKIGVKIILSYHNFEETPSLQFFADKYQKAIDLGADFFKVAVKAQRQRDLLQLVKFASSEVNGVKIVPMAMGRKFGKISRLIFGSAEVPFVYCSLSEAVVPGQWKALELRTALAKLQ